MNQEDLEAFAQFLQMSGMGGATGAPGGNARSRPKPPPSFWERFEGRATVSLGMFAASIVLFRNFGDLLI